MSESTAGDEAIASPLAARWGLRARVPVAERDLIRAAQRGSADALEELARRCWPNAFRVALVIVRDRAAAEDLAQDAIVAALDALEKFNARRPFQPWLQRIVTNKALDWERKRTRRATIERSLSPASVDSFAESGLSTEIVNAFRQLSPEERAAFVLRHLVGMSSREIARSLDTTPGAVRSMLHRTRGRLESRMRPRRDWRRDE